MNRHAVQAIFARNFYSYFANPTGYVFLCVFVFLNTIAAFWSNGFFVNNLANLDQLTPFFPFIMLVFAPAITMNSWAEERRQGTDELLLTLPANDIDVVLGKYFACLAIYTCSLFFSAVCNLIVLESLGNPDVGLFLATYAGFWFVGVSMLAIGMMASFLTGHITISYVWGVLLNAPFVFSACADVILPPQWAVLLKYWSFESRYMPFCKGEISLASAFYFIAIAVVMLYLCIIFIGRRHWFTGKSGKVKAIHFTLRAVFLTLAVFSFTFILNRFDRQIDCTEEQLNSLCPSTVQILKDFNPQYTVEIHAYLSPQIPGEYAQVQRNLESILRQFERDTKNVRVHFHFLERYSEEAENVEKNFGITPEKVKVFVRGNQEEMNIYLGVAMTCGLKQEVIPFLSPGLPVEYEMIRTLLMVSTQERKRLAVLENDADMLGEFRVAVEEIDAAKAENLARPIIQELRKSYEIISWNPKEKLNVDSVDAILAVQPSTLENDEMQNFIEALEAGVPTAIFEDPLPLCSNTLTPTCEPRRISRNPLETTWMIGDLEKAETQTLWNILGVDFFSQEIVSQKYNPIPRFANLPNQYLFIDSGEKSPHAFQKNHPVTDGLRRLILPYAGYIKPVKGNDSVTVTPLLTAEANSGLIPYKSLLKNPELGFNPMNLKLDDIPFTITSLPYILSAEIRAKRPDKKGLHVILTTDTDLFFDEFVKMRALGKSGSEFDFDNVNYVLNVLERLTGVENFYAIRKHQPMHRKLETIEKYKNQYQIELEAQLMELGESFKKYGTNLREKLEKRLVELRKQKEEGTITEEEEQSKREWLLSVGESEITKELASQSAVFQKKVEANEKNRQTKLLQIQSNCKLLAVLLPPVFPLLIAFLVFIYRKHQEKISISSRRLRKTAENKRNTDLV